MSRQIGNIIHYLNTLVLLTLCIPSIARAQQCVLPLRPVGEAGGVVVADSLRVGFPEGDEAQLTLQMCVRLEGMSPARERVITLTPRLVGASDSIDLPPVQFFGRWAYYQTARSGADDNGPDQQYDYRDARTGIPYSHTVRRQPWMNDARLKLVVSENDGCGNIFGSNSQSMFLSADAANRAAAAAAAAASRTRVTTTTTTTTTDTLDVVHEGNIRHFDGSAFIDYPVNRTEVFPEYHDNTTRLEEIRATIDSVLHNNRSLLQHITLKGYASPEGRYAHNVELARGRVHSLRRYIIDHFDIPDILISADYEPEDWEGMRRYVVQSQLPDRAALLKLIDSNLEPDAKLAEIARRHPESYKHLLHNVFPYLRHTDYRIDYVARDADRTTSVLVRRSETTTCVADTLVDTLAAGALVPGSTGAYVMSELGSLPGAGETYSRFRTFRAHAALKTNLLFDAALAPNIELEVPLGHSRWSLMAECWFPWFRFGHNALGDINPYYRSDQRPTRHSYEIQVFGGEVRYWLSARCNASRPALCGLFVGLYGAGGKYDVEWDSTGDQGEFTSLGLTAGYSWPIARHWNLELSGSLGYVGGPQRHYEAEFDDARLIFRNYDNLRYVGPTKLKLSIGYIF